MNRTQIHEPWAKPWIINQGLTLSTTRSSWFFRVWGLMRLETMAWQLFFSFKDSFMLKSCGWGGDDFRDRQSKFPFSFGDLTLIWGWNFGLGFGLVLVNCGNLLFLSYGTKDANKTDEVTESPLNAEASPRYKFDTDQSLYPRILSIN